MYRLRQPRQKGDTGIRDPYLVRLIPWIQYRLRASQVRVLGMRREDEMMRCEMEGYGQALAGYWFV